MGVNLIGWLSSLVLLLTLAQQVRSQWSSRESRGVSTWLFVGQLMASGGFAIYSYLLGNWVFLATNLLLVANAAVGEWVTLRNRRLQAGASDNASTPCLSVTRWQRSAREAGVAPAAPPRAS